MRNIIGIISYLPDDKEKRSIRFKMLIDLINKCNMIFDLPIYILIQNYYENEMHELSKMANVELSFNYSRLGIVGARKKLRKEFLDSEVDNLIMLDDDSIIDGMHIDGLKYIDQIEKHPGMFYEFQGTLLKLFAISREVFAQQDFFDVKPEDGEGFEDRVFVSALRHRFPDKRYVFERHGLEENSISTEDRLSTWYTNQDNTKMLNNTKVLINEIINC